MFKYLKFAVITLFLFLTIPVFLSALHAQAWQANAQEKKIDLYFFYGDGCPHCAEEEKLLDKIEADNKNVNIHRYEVWSNKANQDFLNNLAKAYNWNIQGVPLTVIGENIITGYFNEETTGKQILNAIDETFKGSGKDMVGDFLKGLKNVQTDKKDDTKVEKINLPFFGEIEAKNVSLPLLTLVIAGLDGLNPCALWVLVFLISMLAGVANRKKLFILGSTFIISSGIFYYLILAAWLNFLVFVGYVYWIRIIIGLVALYCGYYYIRKWRKDKKACETVDEEKRKEIILKTRDILSNKAMGWAVLGIAVLSVSVALFELVCSAGLPAVYTQVLASSDVSGFGHYAYLLLYVLVFKAYEIAILAIALTTMKVKALNPNFILRIGLLGGIVMFIIGLLLLFKPAWIMFG